jgi:hypothetical protein
MTSAAPSTQLVLHVGRSKTGTTALQRFLAANRDALSAIGLQLPDFFIGPNHADLAIAYSREPGVIARALAVESPADQDELRARIDEQLRAHVRPGQTWLFTSEHLSTRLRSADEVHELLADLGRHFERIWVVAQIRRPDHLAPSLYSESIKDHGVRVFDADFVRAFHRHFDQQSFHQRWLGHGAQVVLLPYLERYRSDAAAFFSDWMAAVERLTGIPVATGRWRLPDRPANASLSAAALEYLRQVNITGRRQTLTGAPRRKLIGALRHVPGPPPVLTSEAAAALSDHGWSTAGLEPVEWDGAPLWAEWFQQEPGPVGGPYQLSDEDRDRIARICRQHGASPDGTGWADRLPPSVGHRLRRTVIRVRRW